MALKFFQMYQKLVTFKKERLSLGEKSPLLAQVCSSAFVRLRTCAFCFYYAVYTNVIKSLLQIFTEGTRC
jgi:hypothetical protein